MEAVGQLDGRKVIAIPRELETLKLPEGWIGVNHYSGGIVYLHKKSRVVTWSRPYSIGEISLRKHDVPVAAIPCLHQIFNLMEVKNEMKSIGECDGPSLAKKARLDYGNQDLQDLTAKDVSNVPNEDSHDLFTHHHTQNLQDESSSTPTQTSYETQINKHIPTVCNNGKAGASSNRSLHKYDSTCLGNSVKSFKVENVGVISPGQLSAYLSRIFDFETLADEDAYKPIFGEGSREEPKIELPDVLKALPFSAFNKGKEKEKFAHSPGSTHLSVLNEYCKKNFKKPVEWIDSICNDNQFAVEAVIDGIKYGRGEAQSKKGAKQLAAKNTLKILMPEPMAMINNFSLGTKELAVFDDLDIDDPTVADCAKSVGLSLPSDVLSKCLKRNQAVCDTNIYFKLTPCELDDRHTYEISCGKHSATGSCKNKRTGKQLASQAILKVGLLCNVGHDVGQTVYLMKYSYIDEK